MRNLGLITGPLGSLLVFLQASSPAQSLTRGPSVWETDTTSFLVAFKTSNSVQGSIDWGPTETLGNTASGNSTATHAIRITGLQPDHFYWYRVRLAGTPVTPVYRTRTFASATSTAAGSDVSFFVFGDSGSGSSNQMRVADLVQSWDWDLGVLPGDIVYYSGQASGFDPYFFTPYGATLRGTPLYPVLGNHDVQTSNGQPYFDAFYLPTANSGTERYYSFDHGKVHFIGLDSTNVSSTQTTWLRNDLMAARANNAPWIFVTFHHPGYSSGGNGRQQSVYQNWCPIFEEFEVDAVFQGHDHIYERTTVRRDYYPNKRGVVYYVVGTGGESNGSIHQQSYSAYALSRYGALKVDVRGNVFRSVFLDGSANTLGQQWDAYTMTRGTVTPGLDQMAPSPRPGQAFQGNFVAPNGAYRALFVSLHPAYVADPALGLVHLGAPGALLADGMIGVAQSSSFSLPVPNQSALVGTCFYFQGITVTGPSMDLRLTDVLCGRVR